MLEQPISIRHYRSTVKMCSVRPISRKGSAAHPERRESSETRRHGHTSRYNLSKRFFTIWRKGGAGIIRVVLNVKQQTASTWPKVFVIVATKRSIVPQTSRGSLPRSASGMTNSSRGPNVASCGANNVTMTASVMQSWSVMVTVAYGVVQVTVSPFITRIGRVAGQPNRITTSPIFKLCAGPAISQNTGLSYSQREQRRDSDVRRSVDGLATGMPVSDAEQHVYPTAQMVIAEPASTI